MAPVSVREALRGRWEPGRRPKDLAQRVLKDIGLPPEVIAGLGSPERRVQSGCAAIASIVSEHHPEMVYPP